MILYFIGGEDVKTRSCYNIMKSAMKDAKGNRVLVLMITTEDTTKIERYKHLLLDYFHDLGAEVSFIYPWSEKVKLDCDLIYIPGGLPKVFLEYAKKFNLKELLKKFNGVIVGNSAGALVLCKDCIITADEDHPETEVVSGLGLVNFSVEVHYNGNEELMKKLVKDREIYAIEENSAIRYDTETKEFRFFGKVHHFKG